MIQRDTMTPEEVAKWERDLKDPPKTEIVPKHHTARQYRLGCRCQPCRDAWATYQRSYRKWGKVR